MLNEVPVLIQPGKPQYAVKIIFIINLLILAFAGFSCNTTEPPIVDNTPPGKRDYIWSIDSVDYGELPGRIQLESIWGSSAEDVWGANGDAPDVRDCLWHYDGIKWSRATEGTPITEFTGNKVVYALWGSAQNNVWAFGRKINQNILSAFIMHYDGARWIDVTPANITALSVNLYCVNGIAGNNIWVGGYEYALHYNGSIWTPYKVADSIIVGSITSNGKYLYAGMYSPWGKNIQLIYVFSGNKFQLIDQTTDQELKFSTLLWARNGELFSFLNGAVFTNINDNGSINISGWERIFSSSTFFSEKCIQSNKNVFAVGQWNLVYHFNGTDWARINITIPNHSVDPLALFWGVWTEGNEVFISDTQNGIIYHGR